MRDLMRSEWRRFRAWAAIAALGHGLALLFLARTAAPLQWAYADHVALLVLYMLAGLALALVQVGAYRKPSQWLWLVHRPLPPARIFAALAGSALAILATTVLLPLLAMLLALQLFTDDVVDLRHYAALVPAIAFTAMAWLAGAYAVLSRRKAVVAVLVAPLLLALHLAPVGWLLLPVLGCVAWLGWIVLHAFRADRDAPIVRPSVLLLTALPLQLGLFVLAFHLGDAAQEAASRMLSRSTTITEADLAEADLAAAPAAAAAAPDLGLLGDGLAASTDPRAASWREQLPLMQDVLGLAPDIRRFPLRHQPSNVAAPWFDRKRGIEWTFSHDRMRYRGRDIASGADRGWWGTGGAGDAQPFAQVPLAPGLTRDTLYAIDAETQRQHVQLQLPAGESFLAAPARGFDRLWLLTDRRLLVYRADRDAADPLAPPRRDWAMPLPGGGARLAQVDVAELLDGWLVSYFYGDAFDASFAPWQQVVFVSDDGVATVVAERRDLQGLRIVHGSGPVVPAAAWSLSPVLYALATLPDVLLPRGIVQPAAVALWPDVAAWRWRALAFALLSVALAAWWLRRSRAGAGRRRLWLATCALLGLPAFLSLLCLEPRR